MENKIKEKKKEIIIIKLIKVLEIYTYNIIGYTKDKWQP